ncbi:MAG: radical SAM protein [Desulfurococcales archaeon]|nr:radical SAM protein [Desulfurococcales archaeon]
MEIVFGPVPSRRLGRSLGVNNIPPKHCSYSCIYCQLGRTQWLEARRRSFYEWTTIVEAVKNKTTKIGLDNIDYITFVPDGEPTIDINLGKEIQRIKEELGAKVAVITNGSLLWMEDVREDLLNADWVSVKIDAVSQNVYKKIDRPHPSLELNRVLYGIQEFAKIYSGTLVTETMLVEGVNDFADEISLIAEFIGNIDPAKAYIAVPTRPPAEPWVTPPSEKNILVAYNTFTDYIGDKVELLIGFEGGEFIIDVDKPVESILGIISVHPIRIDVLEKLLEEKGLDPKVIIEGLKATGHAVIVRYRGKEFLIRRLTRQETFMS